MAGRIQFKDRAPEPVGWLARLRGWMRDRYRLVSIKLGRKGKSIAEPIAPEPRIRFRVRERDPALVIRGAPIHCPACGLELLSQSPTVVCTLDAAHVVHARCSEVLVRGKCPLDGADLKAAG